MASREAPENDFTPSWLNFSESPNPRPSGSKSSIEHSNRPGGFHSTNSRRRDFQTTFSPDYHVRSSRHFDDRQFSSPFRSGRTDDDHFFKFPSHAQSPSYNGYTQSPQRFNHRSNGFHQAHGYFDHVHAERSPKRTNKNEAGSKERHREKRVSESSAPLARVTTEKGNKKASSHDEEFPSLRADSSTTNDEKVKADTCKSPATGVWDKNAVEKITNPAKQNENVSRDVKHNSNIFTAVVPRKAKFLVKQQHQQQQNFNKEKTSKTSYIQQNGGSPTHAHAHRNNRDMTSPRNILNTRTVTQPRAIDKKSDFLKALKQNDLNKSNAKECNDNNIESSGDSDTKSIPDTTCFDDLPHLNGGCGGRNGSTPSKLSSSMEEECRLLQQMGWTDCSDVLPLTDEEIREYEKVSGRATRQHGRTNGLIKGAVPALSYSPTAGSALSCSSFGSSGSISDVDS